MTILTGLRAGSIQLLVELSVCEYSRILSVSATFMFDIATLKNFLSEQYGICDIQ